MRFEKAVLPAMLVVLSLTASAQAKPSGTFGTEPGQVAHMEIGLGYTYFHANAPPSGCGCFSLNGGAGSVTINASHGLGLVVDLSGVHASQVNSTAQWITIFDYFAGPRYSFRSHSRFTPFVQGLIGGSRETSNTVSLTSANAFAGGGGAGVNAVLGRHLGWNIVEVDYIYSQLPNGVNNYQSDLRVSSRILFRF